MDKTEYTTDELQETFKVLGFSHGYCAVEHKKTGEKGSFDFKNVMMNPTESKRIYFNYKKA